MPKQLTVHNATITTASVEVKTLTISGKQVTLAVFRQLREEQLIAEDGTLNGVPWGYVNYHPDKCDSHEHRHVVWQHGNDLLRSRVDHKADFEWAASQTRTFMPTEGEWLLASRAREWINGEINDCPVDRDETGRSDNDYYVMDQPLGTHYGFPVRGKVSKSIARALYARLNADAAQRMLEDIRLAHAEGQMRYGRPITAQQIAEHEEGVVRTQAELASQRSALDAQLAHLGLHGGQFAEAFNAAVHAEHLRRQRHRDVRKELAELPQLFIAV